jgi:hypothetical protein
VGVDVDDEAEVGRQAGTSRQESPDGRGARAADQSPSRRFSASMIALRPDRDGHIVGYEASGRPPAFGDWIIDPISRRRHPTQPVEASYMANA